MRTWEDNADEFKDLLRGEGWPFACLVACSVEYGVGQVGVNFGTVATAEGKVSAEEFGKRVGWSRTRILHYHRTWQYAASKRLVPDADTLTPDDAHKVPYPTQDGADVQWRSLYRDMDKHVMAARAATEASAKAKAAQAKAAETPATDAVTDLPAPTAASDGETVDKSATPEEPATQPEQPPTPYDPPAKLRQYTLTWPLQEKLAAVAAEQCVSETHLVREAVRQYLNQETPHKLADDDQPPA